MLSLNQTTGYAIQALCCLAHCGKDWQLAKDLAGCSAVPIAYLQKILAQLREAGLVESKRGYRGGFRLSRPTEEISLLEVAELVDPEVREPKCLLGHRLCAGDAWCPTHAFWEGERERVLGELRRLTIGEIAVFDGGPGGPVTPGAPESAGLGAGRVASHTG